MRAIKRTKIYAKLLLRYSCVDNVQSKRSPPCYTLFYSRATIAFLVRSMAWRNTRHINTGIFQFSCPLLLFQVEKVSAGAIERAPKIYPFECYSRYERFIYFERKINEIHRALTRSTLAIIHSTETHRAECDLWLTPLEHFLAYFLPKLWSN